MVKNLPAMWETQVRSSVGKIPWRRAWQPTPVFLPGEFCGWRLQSIGLQRVLHDWATKTTLLNNAMKAIVPLHLFQRSENRGTERTRSQSLLSGWSRDLTQTPGPGSYTVGSAIFSGSPWGARGSPFTCPMSFGSQVTGPQPGFQTSGLGEYWIYSSQASSNRWEK